MNCSLAIDSRFQTFAVRLLVKFIRPALPLLSPEILSSLSKLRIFLFNVHLALFDERFSISMQVMCSVSSSLLTLSAHAREGYSSHFVTLSVCHFSILEKAPFSGLKLTSIRSRYLSVLNVALF